MARKRRSKRVTAKQSGVATIDGRSMTALCERFLEWMRMTAYSEETIANRRKYIGQFIVWCEERGLSRPNEVTKPILERYQRHLYHYRKQNGEPLSFRSQYSHLVPLRAYFKWLAKQNHILFNPASELELPRLRPRLPKYVLSAAEAEAVLAKADPSHPVGLRDRAILETLYSTGIRRMELVGLKLYDIDEDRGTVMVRLGKGKKDRMVPIGERALGWLRKYLEDVRPTLVVPPDDQTLFLSTQGEAFGPNHLTDLVRRYVEAAEIGKRGSCHLFRHTMATLMLENGADIRFIQEMLGHANLCTTQVYTQVSIRRLKEIHTATHPARAHRDAGSNEAVLNTTEDSEGNEDGEAAVEELLSSLAADAEDEHAEADD